MKTVIEIIDERSREGLFPGSPRVVLGPLFLGRDGRLGIWIAVGSIAESQVNETSCRDGQSDSQ